MYVVDVCYGNRNEWSEKIYDYFAALDYAREMSLLANISEARVYKDDEVIDVYVDGENVTLTPDEEADEWAGYEDRWDEVGYDPYTGGYDADL